MDFQSGIDGKAFVGASELAIIGWTTNPTSEVQRFRNSKTGRFTLKEPTFKDVTGTVTIEHDFDDPIFELGTPIEAGEFIEDVKLYLRKNDTAPLATEPYWSFPSMLVTSTPQSLEVDGKIQTSFNFEGDGEFGTPGNPVAS